MQLLQKVIPNNFKPILSLLMLLLISTSCQKKENKSIQDFEATKNFSLKSIKQNFDAILKPLDISSLNGYLVIAEDRRNSPEYPLIHVLEKGTLNYLFSKGKVGFGPMEIASAFGIEEGFSDQTFQVYCPMNKKFVTYSLTDTSQLGISEYKQPDELGMYMMHHATDSTVLGIMVDDYNRLVEYSVLTGEKVNGFGNWEKIPESDH